MGRVAACNGSDPAVMIHAVSLGEMNATRSLVQSLSQACRELRFIISTTTQTGFARGQEVYGRNPAVTVIRYPLDFSLAVNRVLDRLRPSVVVLMELEVWPNFLHRCRQRGIPVILVNGRLTTYSFRNYRRIKPVAARMFRRLAMVCAQDQTYAKRFIELGAPPDRVQVTGTMKFDTAPVAERVSGDAELAAAVGLDPATETIWVCGSTGPGEEEIILREYRALSSTVPALRLVIVPRKPERFDEVAELIQREGFGLIRRSKPATGSGGPRRPVILGDTMGELRKFYSLATVVFVGRTLVDLGSRQHGSDMIEPAALAKPLIVGPFTANFAEPMNCFRDAQAVIEVSDPPQLQQAVRRLLNSPEDAAAMAHRAQEVVRREQGATQRHVQVILAHLQRGSLLPTAQSDQNRRMA